MNSKIKEILSIIMDSGYEVYVVGGYVRDLVWGITNCDIDISTNAPTDKLLSLFKSYNPKEFKYGTIKFKAGEYNFDISHFRYELYENNISKIQFTQDIQKDYLRRDFTFNALYMDIDENIISFGSSLEDCKNRYIRFIGDSRIKIQEDFSRLLRFIYFVLKYNVTFKDFDFDIIKFENDFRSVNNFHLKTTYMNKINNLSKDEELKKVLSRLKLLNFFENI